jgi:hypothetical protein
MEDTPGAAFCHAKLQAVLVFRYAGVFFSHIFWGGKYEF